MDLKSALFWGLGILGAIALSATGRIVGDDIKEWTPRLTQRLVNFAVSRMPQKHRDRAAAEWVAELLADTPGVLAKWWYALTCICAAERETLRDFKETFLRQLNADRELLAAVFDDGIRTAIEEGEKVDQMLWTIKEILARETPTSILLYLRVMFFLPKVGLVPRVWLDVIANGLWQAANKRARYSAVRKFVRRKK